MRRWPTRDRSTARGGETRFGEQCAAALLGTVAPRSATADDRQVHARRTRGRYTAGACRSAHRRRADAGDRRLRPRPARQQSGRQRAKAGPLHDCSDPVAGADREDAGCAVDRQAGSGAARSPRQRARCRYTPADRSSWLFAAGAAQVRSGSGARLVSLSRVEIAVPDGEALTLREHRSGGATCADQRSDGAQQSWLDIPPGDEAMPRDSALAVPGSSLRGGGRRPRILWPGVASGPLPSGSATNLCRWPLRGGQLALWRSCMDTAFGRLSSPTSHSKSAGHTVPMRGRPILPAGPAARAAAAGTSRLDLEGSLETPIRIATGPIGFGYPGVLTAREIDVGPSRPPASSTTWTRGSGRTSPERSAMRISRLRPSRSIDAGERAVALADGSLAIEEGAFTLVDRDNRPGSNRLWRAMPR